MCEYDKNCKKHERLCCSFFTKVSNCCADSNFVHLSASKESWGLKAEDLHETVSGHKTSGCCFIRRERATITWEKKCTAAEKKTLQSEKRNMFKVKLNIYKKNILEGGFFVSFLITF